MSEQNSTKLRMWASTRDQIGEFLPGMPVTRALDVLTHAWWIADNDHRLEAIRASHGDPREFQSQLIWASTYERLNTIRLKTGLDFIKIFDCMIEAWKALAQSGRDEAIQASMQAEATPTT